MMLGVNPYPIPRGENWREQAKCRGMDTSTFFPEDPYAAAEAKKVCADCPVQAECRAEGLLEEGVWGGLASRSQRRQWVRQTFGPVVVTCVVCGSRSEHRTKGYPPKTCSLECREVHVRRRHRGWRSSTERGRLARVPSMRGGLSG